MARAAQHRSLVVLLVLLATVVIAESSLASSARRLLQSCRNTPRCGYWCGPFGQCDQPYPGNGYPGNGGGYPGNGGGFPGHGGAPPGSGGGQQQCVGGLEFGLENCLCDGARVGIPAGEAACGLVISECVDFAAFAAQQDKTLNAIQEVCDTFAKVGCASAADQALVRNPTCGDAVTFGTARCPRDRNGNSRAKFIFEENVARMCSPLCPNCVRG
eukprot:jgi/Tetstr1/432445/TSEL_021821.t1